MVSHDYWLDTNVGPDPNCKKCKGRGHYVYSTHGTPHSTICNDCCPHDQGRWLLKEHYGVKNGKWCCKRGCGKTFDKEI